MTGEDSDVIEELFRIGPLSVSPFGVMLVAALVAALLQLRWGLRRTGLSKARAADDAASIVLAGALGGVVGGKAYYALLHGDWQLLYSRAGLVWYGGFLAGAAVVLLVMRRRRMPPWSTADAVAPALALGYGVGRIGCLLVGDDYGGPTDLPWGMTFPRGPIPTVAGAMEREFGVEFPPDVAADALVAVHPTQIYETLTSLAIFWLGRTLLLRGVAPGGVVLPVIGLLSLERFLVEFLRAKDDRFFGPLTVAQLIAVALMILIVALWLRRRRAS